MFIKSKFEDVSFGGGYLEGVKYQENKCHSKTREIIESFSPNLPELEENIGKILYLLEGAACCGWGVLKKGML